MNVHKLQLGFFIALIALAIVLNFFVFLPFISIIFLAIIFATVFEPLHRWILSLFGGGKSLAALVSVCIVLVFILAPLTFFGILLFQESSDVYTKVSSGESSVVERAYGSIDLLQGFVNRVVPQFSFDIRSHVNLEEYATKGLVWLSNHLAVFFSGVIKGIVGFLLMILALFYFFRDGKRMLASLTEISPLFDIYDKRIINKIRIAINSVVRGQLTISIIQGILTGFGFYIFNVPNPVMWGAVAAIASLVPTIGTALVLAPAIIFLFLTGSVGSSIGLLIWGFCAVGLIDNLLAPTLINRGVKIHPFFILISVLGGIALFGPIGFIAGPVALSLLFALLDIYPTIMRPAQMDGL